MQYTDVRQHKFQIFFLVAGIAIVIIVLGVAGSLLERIDGRLRGDAELQVSELTQQAANNAADHVALFEHAIDAFTIQTAEYESVQPALENLKDNFGFSEAAFLGADGKGYRSDGSPYTLSSELYGGTASISGQIAYSAPYATRSGGYAYHATKPVEIRGEVVGELHVDIPIDMLINSELYFFQGEGFSILFDAETAIIAMEPEDTNLPLLEQGESLYDFLFEAQRVSSSEGIIEETQSAQDLRYITEIQLAVTEGDSYLGTCMVGGEQSYVCVTPVGAMNAYVCSIIPESSVRSEAESITATFGVVFGIVLACLLAMLIMSFFFYRKRMEEKSLEMKTHLYGALSDSLDMAVNMYSPDDSVVTPIVAKAREIIGYPMAEFMGNKRIADKIDLSEEGRDMLDRIRNGQIATLEQGFFSLKDRKTGELRWVAFSVTPFFYEDKRQLLVVFRDSTNEKNLQLSMKDAMVAAETANKAKSDFLSRMSHEIRTPMNAIIGMTQIAENHIGDMDKVESSLGKIIMASDHLLSLINDVLDISKIESGKMILANEEFSFSELIDNVAMVINTHAMQKNQVFTMEVSEILEDRLIGDKVRMQQILINLLSNSIKYTPKNGHISLTVKQEPSTVRRYVKITFVVSDDGIGMSPEYQKHIFEPFVMEGRSVSQGTGLGMPIVKNILTMINGDIQVESEIDKGTTFTVVINLERASAARREDGAGTASPETHDEAYEAYGAADLDETSGSDTRRSNQSALEKNLGNGWGFNRLGELRLGLRGRIEAVEPQDDDHQESEGTGVGGSAEDRGKKAVPIEEIDFSSIRVLLAEDNELNAEIAKELLADSGLTVDWAQNGKQACSMFEDSEPGFYDVILMDIQMPLMNGYEATKHIRALGRIDAKKIPIVAMSANAFMEDVRASLQVGMNAHLSKPIDIKLVLTTILEQLQK